MYTIKVLKLVSGEEVICKCDIATEKESNMRVVDARIIAPIKSNGKYVMSPFMVSNPNADVMIHKSSIMAESVLAENDLTDDYLADIDDVASKPLLQGIVGL